MLKCLAVLAAVVATVCACSQSTVPAVLDKDGTFYRLNAATFETGGSARGNGSPCSWERLSSDWDRNPSIDDTYRAFLARGDVASGQVSRVSVDDGQYFVSWGCLPWRHVD